MPLSVPLCGRERYPYNLLTFMKRITFQKAMSIVVAELRTNGRWGTAHIYQATANSFLAFLNSSELLLCRLTPALLKAYEIHLRRQGRRWNTVSTYMRTLRALYNKGVDRRWVPAVPRLFEHVYTGTRVESKRAIPAFDMNRLLKEAEANNHLSNFTQGEQVACRIFCLMFLLRGIPFVDLIHLRKEDYAGGVITYLRRKTGRLLTVAVSPEAQKLLDGVRLSDASSPYLLPFIRRVGGDEQAYREYQLALRKLNGYLKQLARQLGLTSALSSYAARHTWATMAYYCEIHPGIISEAMGHSSITVTETYLKPFHEKRIDAANRQVISYVRCQGRQAHV